MQEGADRRGGRGLLAALEPLASRALERRRELDQDRSRLGAQAGREATLVEDLEHPRVLGEHLRAERGDAGLLGALGELLEQEHRDAASLGVIRDDERDLRRVGADAVVAGVGDDPIGDAGLGHQRAVSRTAGRGPSPGLALEIADHAREAHAPRLRGEPPEEVHQGRRIRRTRRADPDRRTVPEDGVARAVPGGGGAHGFPCRSRTSHRIIGATRPRAAGARAIRSCRAGESAIRSLAA